MTSAESYFLSFTLYAIPANIIGGMCFVIGKEKLGLMKSEYFFIYVPWLVLILLTESFFGSGEMATANLTLNMFITLAQSVACGVLGGAILWPRFFFKAETPVQKLRITALSTIVASIIYAITRILLFAGIRALA